MKEHWIYRWYTELAGMFWLASGFMMVVLMVETRNVWVATAVFAAGAVLAIAFILVVYRLASRWWAQWRSAEGTALTWTIGPSTEFSSPTLTLRSIKLADGTSIPFDGRRVPEALLTDSPVTVTVTYEWRVVKGVKQFQYASIKVT